MSRKMLALAVFPSRDMKFNPARDLQAVDQFGFVNLADAFTKGVIPGALDMTEESFNGVQNPGTLIARSQDVFDGLRKAQFVKSQLDKLNAEERERAEKALSQQAEKSVVESSEG